MNISELSIRRPVLSTVLTLIILLFGFIGYNYLGVREYPSVDNPIISVSCSYPGANADVIENQITEPLEQNINGIPGIRSLSPEHKDYHGIYCGSLPKRDAAYHQGTAWGFLMGGFLTAYMKVHHHSPEAKKQAMAYLAPVQTHLLEEGCIGSISEIFDGDAPHTCRGCYAQAWSVGEILRCYTQDIQKNQK